MKWLFRFCGPLLLIVYCGITLLADQPFTNEPSQKTARLLQENLARYQAELKQARSWLDGIDIDPIALRKKGIKGKKKFVELLDAYARLYKVAGPDANAIKQRFQDIAAITENPSYHDMLFISDEQFKQDATSYLRAAYLMKKMGINVEHYTKEIYKIKDRLDKHMHQRGVDQRMAFHWYYSIFELKEPFPLMEAYQHGLIASKTPIAALIGNMNVYNLTHEIFIPYEYGDKLNVQFFSQDDLTYLKTVLPALTKYYMADGNIDILSEIISCMRFLNFTDHDEYRNGLIKILSSQNENGSWGNYEFLRETYGKDIDVALYLHTTLVAIDALTVAFHFHPYL